MHHIFIYKKLDTLLDAIFHGGFEIGGGVGKFLYTKTMQFALNYYEQKSMNFELRLYTIMWSFCVTILFTKNNALCVTFLYLNFALLSRHAHTLTSFDILIPAIKNLPKDIDKKTNSHVGNPIKRYADLLNVSACCARWTICLHP